MEKIKEENAYKIERNELNLLLERGIKFQLKTKTAKPVSGIARIWKKNEILEETAEFEIHEPTLATLDRISDIALSLDFDISRFSDTENDSIIFEARESIIKNARKLARIVSISVLGEDCELISQTKAGRLKRVDNTAEIDRLEELFYSSLKPSDLAGIASAITSISNLSDFIISIRLLRGVRSAEAQNRVE